MAARGGLVYHWKHGWIPLDHIAALSKAHGSHKGAVRVMQKHGIAPPIGHHDGGSPSRLSIRAAAYRGEAGHLVTGKDTRGRRVSVFAPNRVEAEKAAENIRAGRPAFDATPTPSTDVSAPGTWTAHKMPDGSVQVRSKNGVVLGKVRLVKAGQHAGQWEGRYEGRHGTDHADSPEKAIDALFDSVNGPGAAAQARAGGSPEERRLAAYKESIRAHQESIRATAAQASDARAQIDHSGDGTLLRIDRSDTEARAVAKAAGFKWSSNLGSWYLPRNWSESTRRSKVNALQDKLGRDAVHVSDAGHGMTTTAAEREAATRARAAERVTRMDAKAERAATQADVQFGRAHAIGDMIPIGQPILAGHHSQRRHERDIARIGSAMDKGVAAHRESKDAAAAAERARQTAAGDSPLLRQRRIDRNEAEVRKIDRTLQEHELAVKLTASKPEAAARFGLRPLAPEHHSQITAARAELSDQIAHDRAQIAASGHQGVSAEQLAPGDVVQYRGRTHVVKKVNKTTVAVPTGYSWDDKVPINQITKHIKLADMPVSAIRSAIASEKDLKVREHFVRELNRRGLHITP